MKKIWLGSLLAALGLLLGSTLAAAAPVIAVDMDPITPGIDSTLTVLPGDVFTVDVVIFDDGTGPTTTFDTVILEVFFNDAGTVLGLGPTGPLGGTLASNSLFTLDVFGGGFSATGASLGVGPSGAPFLSFADGSGAIGLADFLTFTVGTTPTTIFSLDFTALAVGTSGILAAGTPPGSPELALSGSPIFATLQSGTVEVVPEPGTVALLGSGLAGMLAWGWRRHGRQT